MAPKRVPVPPPSLSSDDEKEEHLIDGPNSDSEEEVLEEGSSSEDEQQKEQEIKSQKATIEKPHVSDSEEEEEDAEEEDAEEEEEEEEGQQTPAPAAKKPAIQKPHVSDSESESEFELGKGQHSPTASDFTIKPISSKPMVESIKRKKPVKGKLPPAAGLPVGKPPAKRAIEVVEQNGAKDSKSKRSKVSNGDAAGENEEKKSAINRLWSDDDEIAILQGIIDYRLKKGGDPNADMGAFHDFIKQNLHVDVSKGQLSDKVRRLKKKYQNNVEKNGEDASFSKPHDYKSFELSKKIWGKGAAGSGSGVDDGAKSNNGQAKRSSAGKASNKSISLAKLKDEGKAIVVREKPKGKDETKVANVDETMVENGDEIKVANGDFAKMYPYLNSSLEVQWEAGPFHALSEEDRRSMKEKFGRNKKAQELNEGFKMLKMKELELHLKKLELMKETTGMFLGALKSDE